MTSPTAQTEANTLLVIRHPKRALPLTFGAKGPASDLQEISDYLSAVAGGAAAGENAVDIHRGSTAAAAVAALAVAVMATSSGTVGVVINGVTLTVTWATSDKVSQTLLSAAIRASSNALVAGLVGASNLGALVTLATSVAGDWVEIQPVGAGEAGAPVRFTGVAGAAINGPGHQPQYSVDTDDTAAALSLAAAITAYPGFAGKLYAASALGVVTILQLVNSTTVKYRIQKSGSPITLSAAGAFAAQASCVVWALQKGKIGNCITIAASGTNVSILGSLARLGGGVGGDTTLGPTTYRR